MRLTITALVLALTSLPALAQQKVEPARADAAIKAAFPSAPADWASRLTGDETMQQCSAAHNGPAKDIAGAIQKREQGTIVYPPDNNFMGDWKKAKRRPQSGNGWRSTNYHPSKPNAGNCNPSHQ